MRWLDLIANHWAHQYSDGEVQAIIRSLSNESHAAIERAMTRTLEECTFFPKLADIRQRLETDKSELPPWDKLGQFKPFPHDCAAKGTKVINSAAFKMLQHLSHYEANHVCCPGAFRLRCPNCGVEQQPFTNPFLAFLIDRYPRETKGWNPAHKGFVLCGPCDEYLKASWKVIPGNDPELPVYCRAGLTQNAPQSRQDAPGSIARVEKG